MSGPDNRLLSPEECTAAISEMLGWSIHRGRLNKIFEFDDFPQAIAFMTRVGYDAERICHHPNWKNVYNRVEVELWSHDLGGVSSLCVELAKVMDKYAV